MVLSQPAALGMTTVYSPSSSKTMVSLMWYGSSFSTTVAVMVLSVEYLMMRFRVTTESQPTALVRVTVGVSVLSV